MQLSQGQDRQPLSPEGAHLAVCMRLWVRLSSIVRRTHGCVKNAFVTLWRRLILRICCANRHNSTL